MKYGSGSLGVEDDIPNIDYAHSPKKVHHTTLDDEKSDVRYREHHPIGKRD